MILAWLLWLFLKKLTNSIIKMKTLLPIMFVCLFSCNNEPVQDQATENSNNLTTIIQTFNVDNQGDNLTTFVIDNNLNSQIVYSNDSYSVNTFSNGLMVSEQVFDDSNILLGYSNYDYNTQGKLILISSYTIDNELDYLSYQLEAEYAGNQIIVSKTGFDLLGEILYEDVDILTLNSENRIIKSEDSDGQSMWEADYDNGNLSSFQISGYGPNYDGNATFTYSQELASVPYQKERYRFGVEWRNNIMLISGGNYPFKQLAELGNNYLTGYSFTLDSDNSIAITLEVSYEFDVQGRLMKQIKDKQFFQSEHDRTLRYQYE